ncbi:MAG TPA: hypothetical protein VGA97_10385, partial [Acidimicrobiia bacterium]
SFAGETDYAYPMVQHAISALSLRESSVKRHHTLEATRGYLTRLLNHVLESVDLSGLSAVSTGEAAFLVLGGYSWMTERWIMWTLKWNPGRGTFSHSTLRARNPGQRGV